VCLAYLSRLECGERQPSLAVLFNSSTEQVSLPDLIWLNFKKTQASGPERASAGVVIRAGQITLQEGNGLLHFPSLSGKPCDFIQVIMPVDRQRKQLTIKHNIENWLYVSPVS